MVLSSWGPELQAQVPSTAISTEGFLPLGTVPWKNTIAHKVFLVLFLFFFMYLFWGVVYSYICVQVCEPIFRGDHSPFILLSQAL